MKGDYEALKEQLGISVPQTKPVFKTPAELRAKALAHYWKMRKEKRCVKCGAPVHHEGGHYCLEHGIYQKLYHRKGNSSRNKTAKYL